MSVKGRLRHLYAALTGKAPAVVIRGEMRIAPGGAIRIEPGAVLKSDDIRFEMEPRP